MFTFQLIILLANREYPDQTSGSVASDLGLRCLSITHKKNDKLILVNDGPK